MAGCINLCFRAGRRWIAQMSTYAAGVTSFDGAVFILMEIIGAMFAVPAFKTVTKEQGDE